MNNHESPQSNSRDALALKYDFDFDTATAHSRLSTKWKNRAWRWSELLRRCKEVKRTGETIAEYRRMTPQEQSYIKDVGGFVGGYLANGSRKTSNVIHRSIVTLDINRATLDVWDDFTLQFDCAAAVYSTHKHTSQSPRLRLLLTEKPGLIGAFCRAYTIEDAIELLTDVYEKTDQDGRYTYRKGSVAGGCVAYDHKYAYSHHDIDRKCRKLKNLRVAVHEGEQQLIEWNNHRIDVLLAHPASTAYGLNMQQGGHYIVWFGTGWDLELYQQANARLHLQGQQHPVTVYKLIGAGTVDERANAALEGKKDKQQGLLEGLSYLIRKHGNGKR